MLDISESCRGVIAFHVCFDCVTEGEVIVFTPGSSAVTSLVCMPALNEHNTLNTESSVKTQTFLNVK